MKIKLVVFDFDGVFTDGSITVDINGNELRKFSTKKPSPLFSRNSLFSLYFVFVSL